MPFGSFAVRRCRPSRTGRRHIPCRVVAKVRSVCGQRCVGVVLSVAQCVAAFAVRIVPFVSGFHPAFAASVPD